MATAYRALPLNGHHNVARVHAARELRASGLRAAVVEPARLSALHSARLLPHNRRCHPAGPRTATPHRAGRNVFRVATGDTVFARDGPLPRVPLLQSRRDVAVLYSSAAGVPDRHVWRVYQNS